MTDFDFIKDEELETLTGGVNSDSISSEEESMDEANGFAKKCCSDNTGIKAPQEVTAQ